MVLIFFSKDMFQVIFHADKQVLNKMTKYLKYPHDPNLARALTKSYQEQRSCKYLQDGLFSKIEHGIL